MPPGAKKRKALKKKKQQQQQQEAIGTSTNNNGDNLHGGNDEHGSQDDRESDINLSSPGSQGNQEFGGTQDPSAAMLKKDTAKEISDVIAVERGTVVVVSEKNEAAETSTHSKLAIEKKSGEAKENGKVAAATLLDSAAGKVESAGESEVPPSSSEEKRLLLPGPPAVRTSWLSCCGLFDAMTGSDR